MGWPDGAPLRKGRILAGEDEAAFAHLPQRVLANLRAPASENALLWNMIYPLAMPTVSLRNLLGLDRLWGTTTQELDEDALVPYFWGIGLAGDPMPELKSVLHDIDGPGPQTEVDLFLLGARNLVVIEAKNLSTVGRCRKYLNRTCPEVFPTVERWLEPCRYWVEPRSRFDLSLSMGERPGPGTKGPACSRHYQLARTFLVGQELARRLNLALHMWILIPRATWTGHEATWLDFVDRVRDESLWRTMRVVAWEEVAALAAASRRSA